MPFLPVQECKWKQAISELIWCLQQCQNGRERNDRRMLFTIKAHGWAGRIRHREQRCRTCLCTGFCPTDSEIRYLAETGLSLVQMGRQRWHTVWALPRPATGRSPLLLCLLLPPYDLLFQLFSPSNIKGCRKCYETLLKAPFQHKFMRISYDRRKRGQ